MSARIPIAKMSGAGNDFVVLDAGAWASIEADRAAWIRGICRRGLSVGADGVLVVGPGTDDRVRVTFYNPDGGEAFCGNGTRCAARYALAKGVASSPSMRLVTSVGEVTAVVDGQNVMLTLAPPVDRGERELAAGGVAHRGRLVIAGVPHLVVAVHGLSDYPVARLAPELRRHPRVGPDGANVDFVEVDSGGRVHVRTWERGVENETLACGTGAVAAAFAARIAGGPETIAVVPRSGIELSVTLPGDPHAPECARLGGDARFVFEGVLAPDGIVESR